MAAIPRQQGLGAPREGAFAQMAGGDVVAARSCHAAATGRARAVTNLGQALLRGLPRIRRKLAAERCDTQIAYADDNSCTGSLVARVAVRVPAPAAPAPWRVAACVQGQMQAAGEGAGGLVWHGSAAEGCAEAQNGARRSGGTEAQEHNSPSRMALVAVGL